MQFPYISIQVNTPFWEKGVGEKIEKKEARKAKVWKIVYKNY
jgi:hypothetical protein